MHPKPTDLAAWTGVLGGIAGGFIGLSTYQEDVARRVDERAKMTFELVRHFQSEEMLKIREPLLDYAMSELHCTNFSGAPVSQSEVFAFVEFFDMVQTCLDFDLCEEALASQFFSPYANGHWRPLEQHIMQVRAGEAGQDLPNPYGYGLENLANAPADLAQCSTTR